MAAGDGLISMTPTSIAYSGTSAGINADGGVDFSAVTSLSLNGVFTSGYDNYLIVLNAVETANAAINLRLRSAGTDNSTASSYVSQYLGATGTTVNGARSTNDYAYVTNMDTLNNGYQIHIYGPALAQPTAGRSVSAYSNNGARILDNAFTHNQSVSYDGFTLYPGSSHMTGTVHVFGYEE